MSAYMKQPEIDITVDVGSGFLGMGFADFAGRRGALLPWRQRLRPGWRKIALTAGLCRRLQREGLVSYVLVTARRR